MKHLSPRIRSLTLPLEYPADYIAEIPMTDMTLRPNSTTGSQGRTYQWYNGTAVFPFGHGLHYTNFTATFASASSCNSSAALNGQTFDIASLTSNCKETYRDRCTFRTVSVDIKNTGHTTSDYVTLAFLRGQHGPAPYPSKRLVAYTRLHDIAGGSSQTASLDLTLGSLARVDEHGNKVLYPGRYTLEIDLQPLAQVQFELTGEAVTLDEWPQPPVAREQASDYFVGGYGSRN